MKRILLLFLLLGILFPAPSFSQNYDSPFDDPSNLFYQLVLYGTVYAVVGNYRNEDHLHHVLTEFPYLCEYAGNYISSDDAPEKYFRIDLENHLLFGNGNTYGDHLDIKIRPFKYFYLQSDFFQTVSFNNTANDPSYSVVNFSFCYDRLRFRKLNLGWRIVMTYVGNRIRKAGFSGGFNMNWFILKPLSIHSSISWGVVGQKSVDHFELQAKYHYNRYFLSGGYEALNVLSYRYNFASIGFGCSL